MVLRFLKIQLFLLGFFVFCVSAQTASVAKTDAVQQNLRKDIEYFASDKLEGRRTGEQGATLAAGYVTDIFAKLKLQPGVRSDKGKLSYLQPFPYVTGVEMVKTGNEFRLEFQEPIGDGLNVDTSALAKPVGFSPNSSISQADVVFSGFGIVSDELKFNDYLGGGIKGRVVMIFDGVPDNDNPHSSYARFDVRTKALIAKDHGAVGILLISRKNNLRDDKLTQLRYDQTLGEAALPTFVISRETAAKIIGIPETDLHRVEQESAETKGGLVHRGYEQMRSLVSFQINLEKKRADAYNVIGILPGTDRTLKNEAIIIGAHYDHLGHGGQGSLDVNSTAIHHGADDNASGTAAILELAREFVREKKNKRTLIFIAFGGEEEGLIGSKYYVNNPVFPLDKTIAMINLDMVGRLKDQKLTVGGIGTASEWNQTVNGVLAEWMREQLNAGIRKYTADVEAVKQNNNLKASATRGNDAKNRIGVDAGLQTDSLNLQLNQDGFGPSDHSSFYGKKIPVLFFTGTHEDYHKPSDTADKINYDGLENVVSYVADLVRSIDQHQQRPTYTVAKSSGIGGGRSGFNISLGTVPSYVDSTDGLVLDGVRDNSPAAKAGLKPGDKVVKLAGKDVRNVMDYTYILGEMKAGEEYEIVVIRGGERVAMTIIPVKR
jgi:hypothetical protein